MSCVSVYKYPFKYIRCELQSRWVQETWAGVRVECPLFVSDFDQHHTMLIAFIKTLRRSHFMKIFQWVSMCIIRTDRWTWWSKEQHFCNLSCRTLKKKENEVYRVSWFMRHSEGSWWGGRGMSLGFICYLFSVTNLRLVDRSVGNLWGLMWRNHRWLVQNLPPPHPTPTPLPKGKSTVYIDVCYLV